MKPFAVVLICALAIGCAAPLPTSAPTPSSTPPPAVLPTPTQTAAPSASRAPSPVASPSITCVSDHTSASGAPLADECPSAIEAVELLVARLGPIDQLRIDPGFFDCGDLWPRVGTPPMCFMPAMPLGLEMHGWASFFGSVKVAAISLERSPLEPNSLTPLGPWKATFAALVVPPSGWMMP
jgi:hypothetical protein